MENEIFVTGMGAISSLGVNVEEMFCGLKAGKSEIRFQKEWGDYRGLHCLVGAQVPEYDISKLPRTVRRSMSRMSEMAALAAFEALEQAGISPGEELNSTRAILIMGSTSGSPVALELYFKKLFERNGPEGQVSTTFFKVMNHSVAANTAAALEFNGALLSPSCACATSTQAMILGWELLRSGQYDVVIAGGADELHYMSAAIFDIVMAASRGYNDRPEMASRPFDKDRDGLVVSEGAGVVVMETVAHLRRRGAKPLARIAGGAYLCDSSHMSQSSSETMVKTMQESLRRAKITASEIDYVNAHATGTTHGDEAEVKAIRELFGGRVPVSSLKGHLGHSLAACGALEAIASIKMIQEQMIIPTRNLDSIAPECEGVAHLTRPLSKAVRSILSNSFAFGGMNTSLLISEA